MKYARNELEVAYNLLMPAGSRASQGAATLDPTILSPCLARRTRTSYELAVQPAKA